MKKISYITLFTFLGILLSFLIHAFIEIPAIFLLLSDFEKWGLGFSWKTWEMVHNIGTVILLIIGIFVGFWEGQYWWEIKYNK